MSTVSATMGVMNPLLDKLSALTPDEYKMLKEMSEHMPSFIRDLSAIKDALQKLELVDELYPDVSKWRDNVREMSYDIENHIDDLMGNRANKGFIKKTSWRLKRLRKLSAIAGQIKKLKADAEGLRYKIDGCTDSSSLVMAADPGISASCKEATREDLFNCLIDSEKKLKVVTIVGLGGLGKTKLAKEVYGEIRGQFVCKAFVSVSKNPDMTRLLSELQSELGIDLEESSGSREVIEEVSSPSTKLQDTIHQIRGYLAHKKYLIVVDDLWDQSAWNMISSAFAEDGNGSRVIVTTRVDDVALWACQNDYECIYGMKPLKEKEARSLFLNKVFGSEAGCPPELEEVSAEIIKKCGGFPLAVLSVANLLASRGARSRNEWESINNSLGANLAAASTLQDVNSLLNLSYMQLPLHLRTCLLYLGFYPQDREVKRDDLVQHWIAEGFVSKLPGQDLEDVAKSYFRELINKNLIQPQRTVHGEVLAFTIHSLMLDFILEKCKKHNFIRVAYYSEDMARMHDLGFKVRRLSLQSSGDTIPAGAIANSMSQVRSLALFGDTSLLLSCKYVRVLVVEIPLTEETDEIPDLTSVNQLLELRYLKISAGQRIKLPTEIRGLVHLETLELDCRHRLCVMPHITHLPSLSRLILPKHYILRPEGMANMESLRTLHWFDVGNKSSTVLGELTGLRDLRISNHTMGPLNKKGADALASSIGLQELKYLHIEGWNETKDDQLMSSLSSPPHLEVLNLRNCLITRVPKWICHCQGLRHLNLRVWEISADEASVLGKKLSFLVDLHLWAVCFTKGMAIVVGTQSFPALQHLELRSRDDVTARLEFEAGAMPQLRELTLRFDGTHWGGATPDGMEHLPSLQRICLQKFPRQEQMPDAESAFRNAAQVHPNQPSFTISG